MRSNPTHMRAFHNVAQFGGFSAAARVMNISQPTLSGQIRQLEEVTGAPLFHRRQRGVELTDIGRRLFEHTSRISVEEQQIDNLFASQKMVLDGTLKIGADAPYQLMPLVADYQKHHPQVDVSLSFGNASQLIESLSNDRVDIILAPNLSGRKRLFYQPLQPDQLSVFVSKQHPWHWRNSVRLDEFVTQTVLLREIGSATRAILDKALRRNQVRLGKSMEVGSREAVREAVAAGLGISVIPHSERGNDPRFHYLGVSNAALSNRTYVACALKNRQRTQIRGFFDLIGST
jgi:LysR family transcriptional regulator, low CO2-responsive transcriptional regulator